jgi:hypothetical protein
VKIYVATVEAPRIKERQVETQKTIKKIDGLLSVTSPLNANVLSFAGAFFESHPVYDQTQGTRTAFS